MSIADKAAALVTSISNYGNSVKTRIVTDETTTSTMVPETEKGIAGGVVPLEADSKIAATYLPSFVDDVIEVADYASLPSPGEGSKIYVTLDTNQTYRWSGSVYIEIDPSPGSTDAVPEGSVNLYFKESRVLATILSGLSFATNAVLNTSDSVITGFGKLQAQVSAVLTSLTNHKNDTSNPHNTTAAQVGLGNVNNTSDLAKPVSTATQTALNAKEPTVPVGTTAQFWRGDKTWVDFSSTVLNTFLAGLSTATATPVTSADNIIMALGKLEARVSSALSQITAHKNDTSNPHATTAAQVGLGNVDNTSDVNKPVSTATQTALNAKEPTIASGTTAQFLRGDKTWVDFSTTVRSSVLTGLNMVSAATISATDTVLAALGQLQKQISNNLGTLQSHIGNGANPHAVTKAQVGLGSVDNTSDANKPVSTATQTALNAKANQAMFDPGAVAEVGRFIDMHGTDSSTDYDARFDCGAGTGAAGGATVNLTANGGFVCSGDVSAFSDIRLKTNWMSYDDATVDKLAGVLAGSYLRIDTNVIQVGISAQDLQAFMPEAVGENDSGYLRVAYGQAAMVSAVLLARRAVQQSEEIAQLRGMLQQFEDRLQALENK